MPMLRYCLSQMPKQTRTVYIYMCPGVFIYMHIYMRVVGCLCIYIYAGCPRRNVQYFGRVFLRSNYTDITQNTYIQSSMFTEIFNIEKWGQSGGLFGVCILYSP